MNGRGDERDAASAMSGVAGRTVLVAGATSTSGTTATRALVEAGARVVAVGRDAGRLGPRTALGARTEPCDLAAEAAGTARAGTRRDPPLHGGLPHGGGWRSGGGLIGQTDDGYRFLERSLTALRHVTRAFWPTLVASPAARVAIVSSTAVQRPLAGGANYAAVKAASEAWARAVAQGFAKEARDGGLPLRAASVVFRVGTLAGREDALASAFIGLWSADAAAVNDTVIPL